MLGTKEREEKQALSYLKKLVNKNFKDTDIRMTVSYSNSSEKEERRQQDDDSKEIHFT